jgi:hypothetical protein
MPRSSLSYLPEYFRKGKEERKERTKEVVERVIQPGRSNFFMDDPTSARLSSIHISRPDTIALLSLFL